MSVPSNAVYQNGLNQVSGDQLNTLVQTATTVASLRGFIGISLQQVMLEGFTTPNDGGQGAFYWNSSGTAPDDGGITTVVPNGTANGCWTRLTNLDTNIIPSSAVGVNSIVLTPLANSPSIGKYANYQMFSFVAPSSSTGNVTVQFGNLAALNLYEPNLSQAGSGAITAGQFLLIAYNSALNSGAGGFVIVSASPTTASVSTNTVTPQGRLTLVSGSPVLTSDATAESTVYYDPYVGALIPLYNGTTFSNQTFAELVLNLDSNSGHTGYQASGSMYDLFVFNNSGTIQLATGPAWSTTTSRGTGAGTTQLQLLAGVWTNANSITARFGSSSGNTATVAANQGTYVGTMYATANGQTGVAIHPGQASGGTNNIIGLWNAYNRVKVFATSSDSTSSWTYATATIRAANASTSNRISWIDGLQQTSIYSTYDVNGANNNSSANVTIGVGINSTTVNAGFQSLITNTESSLSLHAFFSSYPLLGFNYVQALEAVSTGTETFSGGLGNMQLTLNTEY